MTERTPRDGDPVVSSTTDSCPDCGGTVRSQQRERVCTDCGLVVETNTLDRGPEWRSFDDTDDTPARTGAPLTVARHDCGLSTEIGRKTDAAGTPLTGRKRAQLFRLRREQSRSRFQSKADRNLAHGLSEVRRIASGLGLAASLRDQACQLFRSAQAENLLRGRSIESMAAASVFGACRCAGAARLFSEVAAHACVDESRVETAYDALNTDLGLPTSPVTPAQFVPQLATAVDCSDRVRRRARELAAQASETTVTAGVHPAGFAAACLYVAAQDHAAALTQAALATAADVTPTTIQRHRDTLVEQGLCEPP